jgi:hypothetical protein
MSAPLRIRRSPHPKVDRYRRGGSLLAYVGWLLPFNSPMGLVTYDQQQAERVTADLFRIGYEEVKGYLPFKAWRNRRTRETPVSMQPKRAVSSPPASRSPMSASPTNRTNCRCQTPGGFGQALAWSHDLAAEPLLVVCASGQRASMAASMLRRQGVDATAFASGGAADLV